MRWRKRLNTELTRAWLEDWSTTESDREELDSDSSMARSMFSCRKTHKQFESLSPCNDTWAAKYTKCLYFCLSVCQPYSKWPPLLRRLSYGYFNHIWKYWPKCGVIVADSHSLHIQVVAHLGRSHISCRVSFTSLTFKVQRSNFPLGKYIHLASKALNSTLS